MRPRSTRPVVVKYGGATLDDVDGVVEEIARHTGVPWVVVVSARAGVTDRLERALSKPLSARERTRILRYLARRHSGPDREVARQLSATHRGLQRLPVRTRASDDSRERLLSAGERLSAAWVAARLRARGVASVSLETDRIGLTADGPPGAGRVEIARSRPRVRGAIERVLARGAVPVVTGYFARYGSSNRVRTVGRGGSDYTASAIGAIVGARRLELVKAAGAIRSGDPRFVRRSRTVPRLSYSEADELAQFGASVLHPRTIAPVEPRKIPILVRSLRGGSSTRIDSRAGAGARAVAWLGPLRLFRVTVPGARGRPGVLASIAERIATLQISLAAVFTTSTSVQLLAEPSEAHRVAGVLSAAFDPDGLEVYRPRSVALVTAIGDGVAAELGRLGARDLRGALALSASPRSLSIVVPLSRSHALLRRMHARLIEPAHTRR